MRDGPSSRRLRVVALCAKSAPEEVRMDDRMLRQAVLDELEFDPRIEAAHIGVAANKGVVTLTGRVSSFAEKIAAERAAMRVRGVKAVAQDIMVRYPEDKKTADDEIAARALKLI